MRTELLIVGAGPFGLSLAAWAATAGLDYVCVGSPMEFWRSHMPKGMLLRSGPDWHLDPCDVLTLERFLTLSGSQPNAAAPIPLHVYLDYAQWLQDEREIRPLPARVTAIAPPANASGDFHVTLDDRRGVSAHFVAVAIGFRHFSHVPEDLRALIPADSSVHTSELVDFSGLAGTRCLIVGGRQSAFEWAALMHEAGTASIDIVHRHAAPAFCESDWTWVTPLVAAMKTDPGWYRRLGDDERRALDHRFWSEGRLKLEPWLAPRVATKAIRLRPGCSIVQCRKRDDGSLVVGVSDGTELDIDRVVFATGYRVNLDRVPFLRSLTATGALRTRNGFPELDDHFQTSIPNLYVTSMPATQDFGPFLAFTVSARVSATLIGDAIMTTRAPSVRL